MNPQSLLVKYAAGDRNFAQFDLHSIELSDTKLTGINLSQSQLHQAQLRGIDLAIADLSNADLSGAILTQANLQRADLSGANLTETDLTGADLEGALLRRTWLERANASRSNLHQAVLTGANLVQARLHSADLSGADLSGANCSGAELRQAKLCRANLQGSNFQGANLRWADLSGADLRGADFTGAVLSGATLTGANLSQTILLDATFVHADLTRAALIEVDWAGADLTGANLTGAKLYSTRRFGPKFDEAICPWIDLSPNGDRSRTFEFTSDDPYEYFYRATPALEIVVDNQLNIEAYSALAVMYQRLARQLNTPLPSPNITVNRRRTTLTFDLHSDEKLFTIAYLMMYPFTDANISNQALTELLKSIGVEQVQKSGISVSAFELMVAHLNQHRQKMISNQQLQSLLQSVQNNPFFQAPTRSTLRNSGGQSLLAYSSCDFGRRSLVQSGYLNGNIEKPAFHQPSPSEVVEFISGFRWSEKFLKRAE
jgi:uncharacterized protein YjbI with pentapeptide repeats